MQPRTPAPTDPLELSQHGAALAVLAPAAQPLEPRPAQHKGKDAKESHHEPVGALACRQEGRRSRGYLSATKHACTCRAPSSRRQPPRRRSRPTAAPLPRTLGLAAGQRQPDVHHRPLHCGVIIAAAQRRPHVCDDVIDALLAQRPARACGGGGRRERRGAVGQGHGTQLSDVSPPATAAGRL